MEERYVNWDILLTYPLYSKGIQGYNDMFEIHPGTGSGASAECASAKFCKVTDHHITISAEFKGTTSKEVAIPKDVFTDTLYRAIKPGNKKFVYEVTNGIESYIDECMKDLKQKLGVDTH